MREAGKILGTVLNELSKEIKPGMTTHRIDQLGEEMIRSYGVIFRLGRVSGIHLRIRE